MGGGNERPHFSVLTLMLFVAPAQAGAHAGSHRRERRWVPGHRAIPCSVAVGSRLRGNDALDEIDAQQRHARRARVQLHKSL
jgi:hypothetical protein